MARKTHTSTEVKQRWEAKAYTRYMIRLRNDADGDLIRWIEKRKENGEGITEIVRDALQSVKGNN